MTQILALSKEGINVLTATDPNDFIFHSLYNTFKIIATGTLDASITTSGSIQEFTLSHGLSFTPLALAFCRFDSGAQVMGNNNQWRDFFVTSLWFQSVSATSTQLVFRIQNSTGSTHTGHIRYYIFEVPF